MKSKELIIGNYEFDNIGAMCPYCYTTFDVGKVSVNVEVNVSPEAETGSFAICPEMILNTMPDTHAPKNLIHVTCPSCNIKMIIVDSSIKEILAKFNTIGLYTKYSCDGNSIYEPYIAFYMKSDNMEFLVNEVAKYFGYNLTSKEINTRKIHKFEYGKKWKEASHEKLQYIGFYWEDEMPQICLPREVDPIDYKQDCRNFWKGVEVFANAAETVLNSMDFVSDPEDITPENEAREYFKTVSQYITLEHNLGSVIAEDQGDKRHEF